jgi:hypothetical protein
MDVLLSTDEKVALTCTAPNWPIYALVRDCALAGTILINDKFEWVGNSNNGQASHSKGFRKYNNLFEFISIKMQVIAGNHCRKAYHFILCVETKSFIWGSN